MTPQGSRPMKKLFPRTGLTRNTDLYLLLLPTVAYFLIFHYGPMIGLQIAFKDYRPLDGFWLSPWVGLKHFERFLRSYQFVRLIYNTLSLSVYQIVVGFPLPILFALALNQVQHRRYKQTVQTVSYAPHFISTVVMVGLTLVFLSRSNGLVNQLLVALGFEPVFFMGNARYFQSVYVLTGVWQHTGWSSIIYLATLSSIDPQLHEAAIVDGASRMQRILKIDIPSIVPTIVVILILSVGRAMSVGFEKAFLLQTPLNLARSEIIATYVYKVGLISGQFSFSTAVGLFNSVINLMLLYVVNRIARSVSGSGLW